MKHKIYAIAFSILVLPAISWADDCQFKDISGTNHLFGEKGRFAEMAEATHMTCSVGSLSNPDTDDKKDDEDTTKIKFFVTGKKDGKRIRLKSKDPIAETAEMDHEALWMCEENRYCRNVRDSDRASRKLVTFDDGSGNLDLGALEDSIDHELSLTRYTKEEEEAPTATGPTRHKNCDDAAEKIVKERRRRGLADGETDAALLELMNSGRLLGVVYDRDCPGPAVMPGTRRTADSATPPGSTAPTVFPLVKNPYIRVEISCKEFKERTEKLIKKKARNIQLDFYVEQVNFGADHVRSIGRVSDTGGFSQSKAKNTYGKITVDEARERHLAEAGCQPGRKHPGVSERAAIDAAITQVAKGSEFDTRGIASRGLRASDANDFFGGRSPDEAVKGEMRLDQNLRQAFPQSHSDAPEPVQFAAPAAKPNKG